MEPMIREYRDEDRSALEKCLAGLQGFLHALDPLERLRGIDDFDAVSYTNVLLEGVHQKKGVVYLAEYSQKIVGCIAGWVIPSEDQDLISHHPTKTGKILELFVSSDVRGKGIGARLMKEIEEHFRTQDCDSVRVEVFRHNEDAHKFYHKVGYHDRAVDLLKML